MKSRRGSRQDPGMKSDLDEPHRPMPETRLLLLRHAETAAPDLFHGSESDVDLGPRGLDQARRVAGRLAEIGPDAIYSSDMRRAIATARVIAEAANLPPQQCSRVLPYNLNLWSCA